MVSSFSVSFLVLLLPHLVDCLSPSQCGRRMEERVKRPARSWLTGTVVTWYMYPGCVSLWGSSETPAYQRPEPPMSNDT